MMQNYNQNNFKKNSTSKTDNRYKGFIGEKIACDFIKKLGYKIIQTNYHYSKYAEIDIIAKENNTLVFIEVKARKNLNYGHPLESITYNKLKNIKLAIISYLNTSKEKYDNFRLDAISIVNFKSPEITHLKNISLN